MCANVWWKRRRYKSSWTHQYRINTKATGSAGGFGVYALKGRIAGASSAFVYTNAYFALQNACWGHPKPFHSAPFRCRLRIPAERFLPGDALRVIEDLHQMGCRFI